MKKDPIIEEIRKIRNLMEKQSNGSIHQFYLNLTAENKHPISKK